MSEMDEILSDVMNYAVQLPRQYPKHNYEPTDGKVSGNIALFMYEYSRHAHQAIQALIAKECNKARIEELERQEFQDVMMLYAEYETREVVKDRIAELSNKENLWYTITDQTKARA